jgi:TetR/AcrR family transcriptional regulator, regulator of cefoperazone and chloramphenicol sensitivity
MFADWKEFCQAKSDYDDDRLMKRELTPRRRPKKGGYARGDETRAQIIAAALKIFGEHGYDRAATREIAREAGVNPPALQYYFDGKEGLHRACAQFIIDRASVTLTPALEAARLAIEKADRAGATAAMEGLLDALTDSLSEPGSESWSRFMHRGKGDGAGPGIEIIRDRLSAPIIDAVARLIALVTGRSAAHDETRLRTLLILSQAHAVHLSRENLVRTMRWRKFDAGKIALIKRLIREQTRAGVEGAMISAARAPPEEGAQTSPRAHRSLKRRR